MRRSSFVLLLVLFLTLGGKTLAQSVRWEPASGQLGHNQVNELALIFDGCEPDGDLRLPAVDGLTFGTASISSQTSMSWINGRMTSSKTVTATYPVRASRRGRVAIPSFTVQTDKGELRVPAASYTVGDTPVGGTSVTVSEIAQARLTTPKNTYWAGEVIPLTYTLTSAYRYFHSLASNVNWPSPPVVAEDWSKPDPREAMLGGERKVVSTQTTRAAAKDPGVLTLPAAAQMVNLLVGQTGFGLFSQPVVEQRQIESEPLTLTIKPLPSAPGDFSGAVGDFALVSKVVPTKAAVNEPVTWTLELTGTGNWPDLQGLPPREVSNDFQVVQPKSKRDMKDGSLFEGTLTEDVVLVPTQPGRYTLGPVKFTYFDTKSGAYKTITTTPVTVEITGSASAPAPQAAAGPQQFTLPSAAPGATTAPPSPAAVAPVPPDKLPRDPLPGPATGLQPMGRLTLVVVCLVVAAVLPLLFWLVLAALRSRQTDPQRHRRAAHAALVKLLAELRPAASKPGESKSVLLRNWQSQTCVLWQVAHAAPAPQLLHACVSRHRADAAPAWARLWEECERALHGKSAALPEDWLLRAEGALRAVRIPGWNFFSLFAPRNLLPVVLFLSLLSLPSGVSAETAEEAYRRGEVAAAEAMWRKTLAADPSDWAARGNLGLALAQQDRWPEAVAQWTSAYLHDSRAEANRWNLALGLQRAGFAPPELVDLSRGAGLHALVRTATPGEWQAALIAAALLFAAALGLLLLGAYRHIGPWARPAALTTCLIAVLLGAAATFSLQSYGALADPSAAMVWRSTTLRSIPTEADTSQKTSPLSAGSLAVVDKTFLGWSRLRFASGEAGWVRTEDLVSLYR